uniref:Uncharacterized protein n=1 Tax=Rhodosorus marinus TaxID=101924 RepID=A0A7S0BMG2_9RHOD|mmetsp:Transcript_22081/g.31971  ORF Transcript_22081/g.31971 Transcript_22081/m.31971 type:complete len:102 (+) Transcript_22081:475-780(+)
MGTVWGRRVEAGAGRDPEPSRTLSRLRNAENESEDSMASGSGSGSAVQSLCSDGPPCRIPRVRRVGGEKPPGSRSSAFLDKGALSGFVLHEKLNFEVQRVP